VPDRVLVRCRRAEIEAEKPHPGQPVADQDLHPRVAQVVLRLQDKRLEHRDRIERRSPTLRAVAVAQPLDQPAAEMLEVHRGLEHLQRVAVPAQPIQMLRKPEQSRLLHGHTSRSLSVSESYQDIRG